MPAFQPELVNRIPKYVLQPSEGPPWARTTAEDQAHPPTDYPAMRLTSSPRCKIEENRRVGELHLATLCGPWHRVKGQQSKLPGQYASLASHHQNFPIKLTRSIIMSVTDVEVKGPELSAKGIKRSATKTGSSKQSQGGWHSLAKTCFTCSDCVPLVTTAMRAELRQLITVLVDPVTLFSTKLMGVHSVSVSSGST